MSTFIVTRESEDGGFIDFASVGDSPIIVLDKDEEGNVVGFQFANDACEGVPITNKNFHDKEVREHLDSPETHLVGIDDKGKTRVTMEPQIGRIEKKKGREVIMASDALVKLMMNCPAALRAKAETTRVPQAATLFRELAEKQHEKYASLWDAEGNVRFDMLTDTEGFGILIEEWRRDNDRYADDVTIVRRDASRLN